MAWLGFHCSSHHCQLLSLLALRSDCRVHVLERARLADVTELHTLQCQLHAAHSSSWHLRDLLVKERRTGRAQSVAALGCCSPCHCRGSDSDLSCLCHAHNPPLD